MTSKNVSELIVQGKLVGFMRDHHPEVVWELEKQVELMVKDYGEKLHKQIMDKLMFCPNRGIVLKDGVEINY